MGAVAQEQQRSPLVRQLVVVLAREAFRASWIDVALEAAASLRADLPLDELHGPAETMARLGGEVQVDQWANLRGNDARHAFADPARVLPLDRLTSVQLDRLWRLARFVDEPAGTFDMFNGPRVRHTLGDGPGHVGAGAGAGPAVEVITPRGTRLPCLLDAGFASRGDLLDALWTGRSVPSGPDSGAEPTVTLHELSARRPKESARSAAVQSVVDEFRQAAIAGELVRGDLPAPLTPFARRLRSASGTAGVTAVLAALGKRPFARGYAWTDSRESSLSHLVRIHQPVRADGRPAVRGADVGRGVRPTAVEFGVYAPEWARMVEQHLGWPGFESAVWWVHAHTNDDSWSVDQEIKRRVDAARRRRRTPARARRPGPRRRRCRVVRARSFNDLGDRPLPSGPGRGEVRLLSGRSQARRSLRVRASRPRARRRPASTGSRQAAPGLGPRAGPAAARRARR